MGWIPAALAVLGSSCVIPVAPQFEDPENNYPPYIVEARPVVDSIVSPSGQETDFTVTLADPNLGDRLYLRWVFDYPPFGAAVTRTADGGKLGPSLNGSEIRDTVTFTASCILQNIAPELRIHRLTLIVSDRPFKRLDQPTQDLSLEAAETGARIARASWILNMECR